MRVVTGMALRDRLRSLKREMRSNLDSFVLSDGTRFYFDPVSPEIFLHCVDCLSAQGDGEPFPEPPEVLKALTRARNREAAYHQVRGGVDFDLFPYEVEALTERGELVPRSLVHGHELGEGPLLDLSEQARAERGEV